MGSNYLSSRINFVSNTRGKWVYTKNESISDIPSFDIFISPKLALKGNLLNVPVNGYFGSGYESKEMEFYWINAQLHSSNTHFRTGYFDFCAETEKLAFYRHHTNDKLFDLVRA